MTYKIRPNCLRCRFLLGFMLILQVCNAQYDFSKADEWLKENLDKLGGRVVMLIYKDGKIIYNKVENKLSGKQKFARKIMARRKGEDPEKALIDFDAETKINIASCSKWLSAALVMTFIDEGKLDVNDTIGKYLKLMSDHGKGNITILHCLAHMTGIKAELNKNNMELYRNLNTMEEAVMEISILPVESAPGTAFRYSSIGLQLAAAVIEKISGKSFETLFAERIAKPCEMSETDFGHKKVPLPAGGAQSTARDYLHFLQMILDDGIYKGKTILKKQTVAMMQQNYISGSKIIYSPAEAGEWGYGFGAWVTDSLTNERSATVTSPGLFGSFPWIDNRRKYAAVMFTHNLQSRGRNEKYIALKRIIDEAIDGKYPEPNHRK